MKGIPVHTSSRIIHIYPTYGFFPLPFHPARECPLQESLPPVCHINQPLIHSSTTNYTRVNYKRLSINLPVKYRRITVGTL